MEPLHPPRGVRATLAGSANYPQQPCELHRAFRRRDNPDWLPSLAPRTLIPRGAGQSYGDSALNENQPVLLQDRLNRLDSFDAATGQVTCEAGTTLRELIDVFLPRGFFPWVTPGTALVTVGGAIAADVHGKNHHADGSFESSIVWFDLLTADGSTLRCSRTRHAELYFATVGGMGLTGIITLARLRLRRVETSHVRVAYTRAADLDAVLGAMSRDVDHRYAVAWIDCLARGASLGRGVVMLGDHAARDDLPGELRGEPLRVGRPRARRVPAFAPSWLLNRATISAFNHVYYHRHADAVVLEDQRDFFYPLDAVSRWQRLYGRRGFVQYQCVIPAAAGARPIARMLACIAGSGRSSFLAVLKRFGAESGGMLSFPMPGLTLALDLPRPDAALFDLLRQLDRITLDHGGRVYLAKDACLDPADLPAMYPRLDEFRAVKHRVDPGGAFSSSQSRRLRLTEPA